MYQIIKGGYNTRHPSSFFMSHPDGLNNYLLLIVKTPAVFQIAGQDYTLSPNQAIILAPHTPCSYSNPYGEYMDDWLHIAAEEDIFPLRGILATNTFFSFSSLIPPDKSLLFLQLHSQQIPTILLHTHNAPPVSESPQTVPAPLKKFTNSSASSAFNF